MAGITHLVEIYKKKGKDFINKLFDKHVTINEKLDASAFAFEKGTDGKLYFYKRNTDIPISLIDRTLMKLYEKPIAHFTNIADTIQLPVGWRFGMEYFINENPQSISYSKVPKNNLVLSYIHVKNNMGKIVRTIQDKEELDSWADKLEIERSPIIFQGVLNQDQKIAIMSFLDTPFDELVKKFKTNSFVKYVVSVLNPSLKKMALNPDLEHNIEGLVFRFGDDEGDEVILAKLIDPVFEIALQGKAHDKNEEAPNEIYQLTIIDAANFIESLNFNKFKPKGRTVEDRYINFMCAVFNAFIEDYGDKYEDLNFNEPSYLKKKEFDLNLDFINNAKTVELINKNSSFKQLFKIFLASFRKKKKRPNGMLTAEVIKQFNGTVDKIHTHLSYSLTESEIPTFREFLSIKGRAIEEEEAEQQQQSDQELQDFMAFKDQLMNASGEQTEEVTGENKDVVVEKPGKKKVNIIVGRFQPFHNGHLSMARDLKDANGLDCAVVIVHSNNSKNPASPFTLSTMKTMFSNLPEETNGLIKDYCFIKRGYIVDVLNELRKKGLEPILWGAGKDRINDYKKQLEYNFKNHNELKLDDKFQLSETDRYGSGTEVRKAIEEDSFGKFKSMVPKTVQGTYHLLRTDMENAKRAEDERKAAKLKHSN